MKKMVCLVYMLATFALVGVGVVGATGLNATDDEILGYANGYIDSGGYRIVSYADYYAECLSSPLPAGWSVDIDNRTLSILRVIPEGTEITLNEACFILRDAAKTADDIYNKYPDQIDFTSVLVCNETARGRYIFGWCHLDRTRSF